MPLGMYIWLNLLPLDTSFRNAVIMRIKYVLTYKDSGQDTSTFSAERITKIKRNKQTKLPTIGLESLSFRVAVFAVHWLAFLGLKGNFAFLPAFRACGLVHLSWPEIPAESATATTATTASVKVFHSLRFPPLLRARIQWGSGHA